MSLLAHPLEFEREFNDVIFFLLKGLPWRKVCSTEYVLQGTFFGFTISILIGFGVTTIGTDTALSSEKHCNDKSF